MQLLYIYIYKINVTSKEIIHTSIKNKIGRSDRHLDSIEYLKDYLYQSKWLFNMYRETSVKQICIERHWEMRRGKERMSQSLSI